MNNQKNIVLCGVGGQGTVLASKLLAAAAMSKDIPDLIIGFEPGETVRMLPYLKTGGHVVVSTRAVKPVTATLSGFDYDAPQMLDYLKANVPNLTFVNADQACSDIGSSKVLNMVLLGAAIRTGVLDFTISEIESIMKQTLPEKFHEMNLRALNYNI